MEKKKEILAEIDVAISYANDAKESSLKFIYDLKNNYEDRLEVYKKVNHLLPINPYYENFDGVDWNKSTLYDDFYCDKYSTFTFENLLNFIDNKNEAILDPKAAIEYFMIKGIQGFINDW